MEIRQIRLTSLPTAPSSELDALRAIQPNLVLVFAAPRFFSTSGLAAWLGDVFPNAIRAGASTAGEITSEGVSDNSLVITALRFDRLGFRLAHTELADMEDSRPAGERLARDLAAPDLRCVLLLSQGVNVNGSALIEGASQALPQGIPITGGLAGDNGAFSQTWCLLDDDVSNRMMLAIGFYGDHVRIGHGSFGGWQSFGPVRQATRTQGNVLYELDGKPALDIYKRYLGDYASGLPASGLLFPFALLSNEQQESGLIRTLLGVDEAAGSLTLAGDIPQGGYVRLMHASTEALVDGAEAAARATLDMVQSPDPGLALLVSCIGRKLVMGDRVDEEVEAVGALLGKNAVLAGFYSNGEISPYLGTTECRLHNQTMTITYLSET